MNKLLIVFGFILVVMFLVFSFMQENKKLNLGQNKFNTCVTEMQKAIPDPNDTETRSAFLKDCQE